MLLNHERARRRGERAGLGGGRVAYPNCRPYFHAISIPLKQFVVTMFVTRRWAPAGIGRPAGEEGDVFFLSIDNAFKARWMAAVMLCSSACHGQPLAGWIGHGVAGRDGDELALPRFAAAAGTAWAIHSWHPGKRRRRTCGMKPGGFSRATRGRSNG
ncbi:MAG TPA: hypothetical protein VGP62_20005 [Bryobacteraceae bacterium]|nr:hypothetical protein [Bryobacteraceae bacterium]